MKKRLLQLAHIVGPVSITLFGDDPTMIRTRKAQSAFTRRIEGSRWNLLRTGVLAGDPFATERDDGERIVLSVDPSDELTLISLDLLPALYAGQLTSAEVKRMKLRVIVFSDEPKIYWHHETSNDDYLVFDSNGAVYVESVREVWNLLASLPHSKK